MATEHCIIQPFPDNIDRTYFGAWLSGLVDGEGCFHLSCQNNRPCARFFITLRADDAKVLEIIRSYLGCGKPIRSQNSSNLVNRKPIAVYSVNAIDDLRNVICPHFDRFSLLAKKSLDFSIWKDAVKYLYMVTRIPLERCSRGWLAKWTPSRLACFRQFVKALKEQRCYPSEDSVVDK